MAASLVEGPLLFIFLLVFATNTHGSTIDSATLLIQSSVDFNITIYGQLGNESCWECPEQYIGFVGSQTNLSLSIDSRFAILLKLYREDKGQQICAPNITMKTYSEHSCHTIYINPLMTGPFCVIPDLDEDGEPLGGVLPVVVAFLIFFGAAVLWILIKYCYRSNLLYRLLFCMETDRLVNSVRPNSYLVSTDLGIPSRTGVGNEDDEGRKRGRLKSLDTFRGLSLMVMIFVNYGGGKYWFFNHSLWNGLTVADLVFPWFIFIMGTAMGLTIASPRRRKLPRTKLFMMIVSRTLTLFILGIMMSNSNGNDLTRLRIPGVLQRFAITYFVIAMLELCFGYAVDQHQYKWWAPVRDVLIFWPEWLIVLSLVAVWVCLTFFLKTYEGCETGYLGPGGIHLNGTHENCTGGAAGYIDRWLLGDNHIYQHPTCQSMYKTTVPYDPEGVLGTLTSIFLCFLGLQSGKILLIYKEWKQRVVRWLVWALILGLIAGLLCNFSQNDGVIPINKNLWSLSFVTAMACFAFLLLTFCYVTIDVYSIWSGAPFFYPGMNPIVIYCGSEVLGNYFPISFQVPGMDSHAAQLAMDIWGTTFWVLVAVYMHWKGVFITV